MLQTCMVIFKCLLTNQLYNKAIALTWTHLSSAFFCFGKWIMLHVVCVYGVNIAGPIAFFDRAASLSQNVFRVIYFKGNLLSKINWLLLHRETTKKASSACYLVG